MVATVSIREETAADFAGIRDVMTAAWGRASEAALIERLRARGDSLSLVARQAGRVVGQIIFTPVEVVGAPAPVRALALGLLAVRPEWRSRGVGSSLVLRGLQECRRLGTELVVLIGPLAFYQRFGFVPAAPLGLRSRWRVPSDLFSVLELAPGAIARCHGVVRYPREFNS